MMMWHLQQARIWIYTILVVLYFLSIFTDSHSVRELMGFTAVISLLISFRGSYRLFQVISTVFLLTGLLLLWHHQGSWTAIPDFMTSTVLLLALLYMLPFMNSVIKIGRYNQQINKLLKVRVSHLGQLYYRISLVSYVLVVFLFLAAIPLIYEVIHKNLRQVHDEIRKKFVSQVVLRGFALATVWSPVEVFIALLTHMLQVSYLSLLPWILMMSATLLLWEWARGILRYRKFKLPYETENAVKVHKTIYLKIGFLLGVLTAFILLNTLVHRQLNTDFFTAVTMMILPFSMVWSIFLNRFKAYIRYSYLVWKKQTPTLHNFMLLFLSVGFFNRVIQETGVLDMLSVIFQQLADHPVILFVLIQLLSLFLTFIGFHPLVNISLFGMFVQPLIPEINPLSLAIVLLTSSVATDASGTYNSTVTMMSGLLRVNPYRITGWNLGFSLLYGSAGTLIALLLL
ncbi:MAG: hypothetical protein H0Z33_14980 [Bacillaceae bacterium]|nr:hypothetical protein [Bacillaceae bacterium]